MKKIQIDLQYRSDAKVNNDNTAAFMGSGTEEVFATPGMIALIENCAMKCIEPFLDENEISVGTNISVSHISSTPYGMDVYAISQVIAVDGKKVDFAVEAYDKTGKIGEGTHTRYVVDKIKFLEKTKSKLCV